MDAIALQEFIFFDANTNSLLFDVCMLGMELSTRFDRKSTEKTNKSSTNNELKNHLGLSILPANGNNSSEDDVSDAVFQSNLSPNDKSSSLDKFSFSHPRKSRSSFNGHKPAEV